MDSRPQFLHQPTSNTVHESEGFEHETKGSSPEPLNKTSDNTSKPESNGEPRTSRRPAWESSPVDRRMYDISLLAGIIVMLVWPWIFWGVVLHLKGIQMNDHLAKVVTDNPHATTFFVTLIGSLVCLIINILFSFSVIRFAQEWVAATDEVTVFHVSLLSAFRYQSWPWGLKDLKVVFGRNRLFPVLAVGLCIGAFTFVTSSTTSLLGPAPFNKTITLTGTELDLASSANECAQFLNTKPLSNNCDWQTFNGTPYTSCLGENQLVDVLESGRGNILSLQESNNTQSLTFSQLGNKDGLHFLGPLRGILPMGPNGVPAFDTLHPSPLSDPKARAAMLSYNYTLEHQGLSSNVTCIYDTNSPITFAAADSVNLAIEYKGTCDGQVDVLNAHGVLTFPSVNADNGLGYWACKSPDSQKEQSYSVYLRGRANYTAAIGNITCTVSPITPAVFPATYHSETNLFSMQDAVSSAPVTYPQLIENALVGLGAVVQESQNWEANLVAESVITFAVKSFGLQPYDRTPDHLRLYAAMIQGILEYEAAYIRLIYSTIENPPASCIRTVEGNATYQVVGWSSEIEHIGFLMPTTLISLFSLAIIVAVLVMSKGQAHNFDPTDTRPLLAANAPEDQKPKDWDDNVFYLGTRRESMANAYGKFTDSLGLPDAAAGLAGNIIS